MRSDRQLKIGRVPYYIIGLCGAVVLLSIFALSIHTTLIADDFRYLRNDFPVLSFMYSHDSGRVAHGIVILVMKSLFGEAAVKIFPIIVATLTVFAFSWLFYVLARHKIAILLGALFAITYIESLHSVYDYLFFFSAATTHSLTLIYIVALVSTLLWSYMRKLSNKVHLAMFVTAMAIGTLSELAAVFGVLTTILFAISYMYDSHKKAADSSIRKVLFSSHFIRYVSIIIANSISFLIIYFSPGSAQRRDGNASSLGLMNILKNAVGDYKSLLDHFLEPKYLLVLALSIGILVVLIHIRKQNITARSFAFGVLMVCIPLIIFTITNYSIGYTALRIYNLADASFLFGSSLLVAQLIYLTALSKAHLKPILATTPLILVALTVANTYSFISHDYRQIGYANSQRSKLLQQRENEVRVYKETASGVLTITPAPLLLTDTEAIDLPFYPAESPKSMWLIGILAAYYDIDQQKTTIVLKEQPKDYCTSDVVKSRFREVLSKSCGSY